MSKPLKIIYLITFLLFLLAIALLIIKPLFINDYNEPTPAPVTENPTLTNNPINTDILPTGAPSVTSQPTPVTTPIITNTPVPQKTPYPPVSPVVTNEFKQYGFTSLDAYFASFSAENANTYNGQEITPNIKYYNNDDMKWFELNKIQLDTKEVDGVLRGNNYTYELFNGGYSYGIIFTDSSNLFTNGKYIIADKYYDSLIISSAADGRKIMVFNSKMPMKYVTFDRTTRVSTYSSVASFVVPDSTKKLVVIDPGHGGPDEGTWGLSTFGTYHESMYNLLIARELERLLEEQGVQVVMIRQSDVYVGLYERSYISNMLGGDIFLSIHINANANDSSINGLTGYYTASASGGVVTGKSLSEQMVAAITSRTGLKSNGSLNNDFVVTRETKCPAVLVEVCFISNRNDYDKLQQESFRNSTAAAMYEVLFEALKNVD